MKKIILILCCLCCFPPPFFAQEKDKGSMAKDANNPLASIKSVSIHNVFLPMIYGAEGRMNTAWIRYAQPLGRILIRASMPISTINLKEQSCKGTDCSGLGDLNIFGTYIFTKPTATKQFGLGPVFSFPTASSDRLGSGRWQAGLAVVAYIAESDRFQFGMLATWQHSFAGDKDRKKVQTASVQPFFTWQLGKGSYLRSTGINYFDLENGNILLPLGLGIGQVLNVGRVVFNLFAEPQFALWHKGTGLPETQLFIGINTQF